MMAQSASFIVLVTALLISTLSYCSAENVYCVTPTATSCSSCPHNSIHCATLSVYAQEAEMYFTPDTTMVFLPGDHVLDRNITVANVTRLTMRGESSSGNIATVVRNGSVGFSFTNMVDINIYSLAFTSYNGSWSYGSRPASNSALFLQSIPNAKLVNCSFHDNIGTALAVNNTSVTLVENKFMHNQCACRSFSEMRELGCGVTTFNSNLTFSGNTSFHNSTQTDFYDYVNCAGAIWASTSSLHFTGTNNFIGNSANGINGVGAIYAEANTSLSFSGTTTFTHNLAEVGGAIVTVENVIVTFNGTNNFTSNSASDSGGAIFAASNTSLSFSGPSHFSRNSAEHFNGGAIATSDHVILTFNGTNNFINNSALGYGGAIDTSDHVILTFNGTNNFINNSAESGGAIDTLDNVILTFNGTNSFINNSAESGGAIDTLDNAVLTFNGTNNFINNLAQYGGAICPVDNAVLTFNGINTFVNNLAQYGGAVYTYDNAVLTFNGTNNFINNSAESGGAIDTLDNAVLTFNGTNNFINNSALGYGGAIDTSDHVILTFNGTNNFINNSAESGGAIDTLDNAVLTFNGTNNFINNSAQYGGAICPVDNAMLTFNGINTFINNSAQYGGAVYTYDNAVLTFNGINNFINNSANKNSGGAIHAVTNISLIFVGTSNFTHNSAGYEGGAVVTAGNGVLIFNGTNNFFNNSANNGGAVYTYDNAMLTFNGINTFINNSAQYGGAIDTLDNAVLTFNGINTFINNSANKNSGGAIYAVTNISLIFVGASNFTHNSAGYEGGAVVTAGNGVLTFNGTNNFINNSANNGGAIYAAVHASLSFTGTSNLSRNLAMQGGAISANSNSALTFNGNINFTNNGHNIRDSRGGAMHLAIQSTFFVFPNTTVCWENNYANLGGAIYVLTTIPFTQCKMTQIATFIATTKDCFFQLPGQNLSNGFDVQLVFKNNSAYNAGSVLYGGTIDNCCLDPYDFCDSGPVFDKLFHYEADNTTSSVSSDPFRVCLCENNHPNCSKSIKTLSVYPGETFQVSLVAVGQREGIVPSVVRSCPNKGRLETSQYIQQTTTTCATINYTVFSQQDVSLELYPEGPCSTVSDTLLLQLRIHQGCPPGFALENSSVSCVCDQALQKYTNRCNITNGLGQITRESDDTFWVGYDESHGLILHPQCPFDNCVSHAVNFSLKDTDMQCAYNRSGLLCGACKNEYSLVLGTSHCKLCTNYCLYLLIPFAVMGVALVFLLLVCKLTVATGTLSGLVFYANIVGANHTMFLPVESTDTLSVFIAWINLDFGIETCFYDGMDAYSKTWLQFVFPVYIWVLVGVMILVSHFSKRFANLLGSNPVSVLATLILLSYAKILRTLISVVSFTNLEYTDSHYIRRAWLYDANVDYIIGKHIPVFLVALLAFFLFLLYTLLLFFGQWLQAISHLRLFAWVNSARLKPFMDSYHAPYKPKHRYWPGLLLVLRFLLLLVFALNYQRDPSINLLAIVVGAGVLQLWAWVSGGVYKNWCLDGLEGSFILNVIVLSVATYHVKLSGGNQRTVGHTSVTIALVTFVGILAYHIFQQLRQTKLWKKVPKLNLEFKKLNTKQAVNNLNNPTNNSTDSESVSLDQLREPWLEDLLPPTHSSI